MTEIRIPKHIMRHEDAVLGCKFDLDGESLYSVKWYKDGFEFYRYVPRDMPPGQVFPLPGVDVEVSELRETKFSKWNWFNFIQSSRQVSVALGLFFFPIPIYSVTHQSQLLDKVAGRK